MDQAVRTRVATFVKTPGYSPLKTRLAKTSSRSLADEFYSLSVRALTEWMHEQQRQSAAECYFAVAEEPCEVCQFWTDFPVVSQGDGGLGQRLARVSTDLQRDGHAIVLLGADAPQLPRNLMHQVNRKWQEGAEIVIGPSSDGGFYMLASRIPLPASTWLGVEYSRSTTLEDLLNQPALRMAKVEHIATLTDVDEYSDLPHLLTELLGLGDRLLTQQENLVHWLKQVTSRVY